MKESYTVITDRMLDLGLSAPELLCYATIFGFSQDGESCFAGSRRYLARKMAVNSTRTVDKALEALQERGLISATREVRNGVTFVSYRAVITDESETAQSYGMLGKQLIYIPRHHGNVFGNLRWKTWDVSYTVEVTGLRSTSYADFFAFDLPAYVLHHAALGKQMGKFRVELRCNNLTDNDYQNVIWRAMPGRSFEMMVNYRY